MSPISSTSDFKSNDLRIGRTRIPNTKARPNLNRCFGTNEMNSILDLIPTSAKKGIHNIHIRVLSRKIEREKGQE